MHVSIQDFGPHYSEFVEVLNDDLSRRFIVRAMQGLRIDSAAAGLGDVFCAHGSGRSECTIIRIDGETGAEKQRTTVEGSVPRLFVLPRNNMLALYVFERITFLDADSLEVLWHTSTVHRARKSGLFGKITFDHHPDVRRVDASGEVSAGEYIFEGPDGVIRATANPGLKPGMGAKASAHGVGFITFDPETRTQQFVPFEITPYPTMSSILSVSPDGKWALRTAPVVTLSGQLELPGERHARSAWMIEDQAVDLWDVVAAKPVRRIMVSRVPGAVRADDEGATLDKLLAYAAWSQSTKDPFLNPKRPPPDHKAGAMIVKDHRPILDLRRNQRGMKGVWEADSGAFWFGQAHSARRITLDGDVGPLMILDPLLNDGLRTMLAAHPDGVDLGNGESLPHGTPIYSKSVQDAGRDVWIRLGQRAIFLPKAMTPPQMHVMSDADLKSKDLPKIKAADIARTLPGVVKLGGWAPEKVTAALAALQTKLTDEFDTVVSTYGPSIQIHSGSTFLSEQKFFRKVGDKDIDVVAEIRMLCAAWYETLRTRDRVFAGSEGNPGAPLSAALAYVAERADDCADLIRDACIWRDGEHEDFTRDVVLRGYIERLGMDHSDGLALAVFEPLLFEVDGRSHVKDGKIISEWVRNGVLDAARTRLSPEDFVAQVLRERNRFPTNSHWTQRPGLEGLKQGLGSGSWDRQVAFLIDAEDAAT